MASPESCRGDLVTEKSDTYVLGSAIFYLLTSKKPYYNDIDVNATEADVEKLIVSGVVPSLPETIESSQDPAIVTMRDVMRKAMEYDPETRPSAASLAQLLSGSLGLLT